MEWEESGTWRVVGYGCRAWDGLCEKVRIRLVWKPGVAQRQRGNGGEWENAFYDKWGFTHRMGWRVGTKVDESRKVCISSL